MSGTLPCVGLPKDPESVVDTALPGAEHEESRWTESEGGSQTACAVFPPGLQALGPDPAFPSGCGLPLQLSNSASVARGS